MIKKQLNGRVTSEFFLEIELWIGTIHTRPDLLLSIF